MQGLTGGGGSGISPSVTTQPSYIVFKSGSTIYAKSTVTGLSDYSGTDAYTVIQAAINAVGYGSIYIKTGDYNLTQAIVPHSYMMIEGESRRGTRLIGSGTAVVQLQDSSGDHIFIRDLTVRGNTSNVGIFMAADTTAGFDQDHFQDLVVQNCSTGIYEEKVENCTTFENISMDGNLEAVRLNGGNQVFFDNCQIACANHTTNFVFVFGPLGARAAYGCGLITMTGGHCWYGQRVFNFETGRGGGAMIHIYGMEFESFLEFAYMDGSNGLVYIFIDGGVWYFNGIVTYFIHFINQGGFNLGISIKNGYFVGGLGGGFVWQNISTSYCRIYIETAKFTSGATSFLSLNVGAATITAGNTSVVVTHGIGDGTYYTPNKVTATPPINVNTWVTAMGATTFTVNISASQGTDTVIGWEASNKPYALL